MSKSIRLSEKWFRRGLWLVALVFASFLISLGSTIMGDLPKIETRLELDDFMDRAAVDAARSQVKTGERQAEELDEAREQARLKLQVAQSNVRSQRESFTNWIATRRATERAEQDPDLIARTQALDVLQADEHAARVDVARLDKSLLDARQSVAQARRQIADMEEQARDAYRRAMRVQQLRVFAYRLVLTLPLLLVAGWLFARKRKSVWWPFVWGFIIFALFAFFVELVPYLPSYGGYVRQGVGIVVTILVGRWAIAALNRYLARQRAAEGQPASERRRSLPYDKAQARLAKDVCPGCERPVDLKDGKTDFCPHCGMGLFERCLHCDARRSSFARFCHACGAAAENDTDREMKPQTRLPRLQDP